MEESHAELLNKFASFRLPEWGNIFGPDGNYSKSVFRKLDRIYCPVSPTSFQFENNFPLAEIVDFMFSNWSIIFGIGALYLGVIFGLREFMKNRKPVNFKWSLFFWNGIMGLLSLAAFFRVVPDLWKFVGREYAFYESLCIPNYTATFGFISVMFTISKILQLVDSLFVVLKKRPLEAIHWFHHVYTLVASWISLPYMEPVSRYFIALNFGEHSLMYPYLALKAVGIEVPRKIAKFIATYQIVQMLSCMVVNISSAYYYLSGTRYCHRHPVSLVFLFVGNVIFVGLFGKQFTDLVLRPKEKVK